MGKGARQVLKLADRKSQGSVIVLAKINLGKTDASAHANCGKAGRAESPRMPIVAVGSVEHKFVAPRVARKNLHLSKCVCFKTLAFPLSTGMP